MAYEYCRHIKTNGKRCRAACLTGEFWCFFHTRLHYRHRAFRSSKPGAFPTPFIIPVIEDRESVQVAASLVAGAVASGHLDEKRATVILRALQVSSRNLDGFIVTEPLPGQSVYSYSPTLDGLELAPRQMNDNSVPPKYTDAKNQRDEMPSPSHSNDPVQSNDVTS